MMHHLHDEHSTNDGQLCTQTFVKVIFPLVMFSGVVEIVGKITGYCYCEHERRTDPERT